MVCLGGLSAAISVLLQSAPVWLPALGMALSPLSTVPVAFIASISPLTGFISFLGTGAMLCAVSIQEALIFIFSTGLLGLAVGMLIKRKMIIRLGLSGGALFCGLNVLLLVFKINLFGSDIQHMTIFLQFCLALFSVSYALIWSGIIRLIIKRLRID